MKKYFEKGSEFAYLFTEGDYVIVVRGEKGTVGNGKKQFATSWIAETVIDMISKSWVEEGFEEKPVPETEIPYKIKTFADHLANALNNKDSLSEISEVMADNISAIKSNKELIAQVEKLIDKWGLDAGFAKLLAALSLAPGSKKPFEKLCEKYDIINILKQDKEFRDNLFYEIQRALSGYYADQNSGLPTKGLAKKVAKMLATSFSIFGYGIYYEGMKTIIRLFENDVVEGIDIETYTSDVVYDPNDYPYYDSIENEEAFLNDFWSKINIEELIQ